MFLSSQKLPYDLRRVHCATNPQLAWMSMYTIQSTSPSLFNIRVCGEVGIEKWVLCVTMRMNIPTLLARNGKNQSIIYPELTFYLL